MLFPVSLFVIRTRLPQARLPPGPAGGRSGSAHHSALSSSRRPEAVTPLFPSFLQLCALYHVAHPSFAQVAPHPEAHPA